jgi:hypothetical protein
MREVPGCVMPISSAVLAERGEHDAVLEGQAAEGKGLEEFGDGLAIGLGIRGCSSWRDLSWGEVGDLIVASDCT